LNAVVFGLLLLSQEESTAARLLDGKPPALPPLAAEGGLVGLELRITSSGIVQEVVVIDDSPPFTEEMKKVVRLWRFEPPKGEGPERVAAFALFRAPTLLGGTPPPPKRLSNPSLEIPYPATTATPAYPPQAFESGVVMLEVAVDEQGAVSGVEILAGVGGFDAVAVEAARKFRFEPAKREGIPVASYAVLILGFPQPVGPPLRRR
jgi:TonB family protein